MNKRIRKKTDNLKKSERIELMEVSRMTKNWAKGFVKSYFSTGFHYRTARYPVTKNKY